MNKSIKVLAASAAVAVVMVGGAAAANASGATDDDHTDTPITGPALERASAVALEHLGEGRVTETEIEDEDSYYEVEVTLDNGNQVDVQLDEEFNVVGEEVETGPDDD